MEWDVFHLFSIIGTIAFAVSGAIVAMEEEYDILGVFVLGLITAFGGGVVRNLLIGAPVTTLWSQSLYLNIASVSILIVFVLPIAWIHHWKKPRPSLTPSACPRLPFKARYPPSRPICP